MLILEQIAAVLGILELIEHLGYDLTLTLLDISVLIIRVCAVVCFHYV